MNTKEYLQQIHKAEGKIKRMERSRQQLRANLYSIGSVSGEMSPDKVQSSTAGDAMEKLIAKVDMLEREIIREIAREKRLIRRISAEIERVPDDRYKNILQMRYIMCWKWERIAVDMDLDIRYVYKLHGAALREFEKIRNKGH